MSAAAAAGAAARSSPVKDAAKVAAWTFALYTGCEILRTWLDSNPSAAAIAPAVASEWVAGRLGVAWSDPLATAPDAKAIARRLGQGAALGATAATATLAICVAAFGARVRWGAFGGVELLVGLIVPVFTAMRHELIAHGLGLRILAPVKSAVVKVLALALASSAFAFGAKATPVEMLVAFVGGAGTALLWVHDRGAWRAVAAHAAWLWVTCALFRGGVIEVNARPGWASGADGGIAGGFVAAGVLAALFAGAVVRIRTAKR